MVRPSLLQALTILGLGSLCLLGGCTRAGSSEIIDIPLGDAGLQTIDQGIYDTEHLVSLGATPPIPVLIVPHHLTASITIASGIRALAQNPAHSILLLSPDHFGACKNFLCTANISLRTPLGSTHPDSEMLSALRASSLVNENSELFHREHGIYAVTPFISNLLPHTLVTPLVVSIRPDWKAHREEILELVKKTLGPDGVLMISSDFSHYLPLSGADAKDEETAKTLFAKDLTGIMGLHDPSQSDCPACLWLAASVAEYRQAYNPSVLLHTNSARILHDLTNTSTTSHFAIAFYQNAILHSDDATVAGDVTLTRAGSGSSVYPSQNALAFWNGNGPRIVNLEGPLSDTCQANANWFIFCNSTAYWSNIRSLATHWGVENNHKLDQGLEGYQRTRSLLEQHGENVLSDEGVLVGNMRVYALTNRMNPVLDQRSADIPGQYRRVLARIRSASGSGVPQIVFVHTGTEYQALTSESERAYGRSFIDAGASAVLAMHTHVVSDMEMYHGRPIFHGLGNFIFDQYDSIPKRTSEMLRLRVENGRILFQTLITR